MKFGNILVGKRLFVGCGKPEALGKGESEIRGSAYVEGPLQVGRDTEYSEVEATVMVAEEFNPDTASQPDLSVKVKGNVVIKGDSKTSNALDVTGDTNVTGNSHVTGNITTGGNLTVGKFASWAGSIVATTKLFDIPHPNKEGHRLAHGCLEGPEHAIYHRGRVNNGQNVIDLPDYWRGLIDYETLTVQLTAIHSHQNCIVKRISPIEGRIYLQAQGGMPVDCFYYIMAQRKDVNDLVVEYEGKSLEDSPND